MEKIEIKANIIFTHVGKSIKEKRSSIPPNKAKTNDKEK